MYNQQDNELNLTMKEQMAICARRNRKKLIKIAVIAIVAVILVVALLVSVYKNGAERAEAKYLAEIEKLQNENSRLANDLENMVPVFEEVTEEVDISVINTDLQQIGELATMEYLYTDANRFSDPKTLFGVNIPFTKKECIAKWDGKIKAGIDVTQLSAEVNEKAKVITVWIPAATILSHEIDDESFEVLDEKNGLFNPIKLEDIKTLEAVSKDAMEQRAIENGLLDKAFENAKAVILKIMNANPIVAEHYSVEFKKLG